MKRIWYYTPQRNAIEEWARRFGTSSIPHGVDVHSMERLQGIEDEVFIRVANHSAVVPQSLWEMLSARGFTIITIDDSNNRRRHEERSR